MSNTEPYRYSCQVALPGFGVEGQRLLQQARVLIVGIGGLGCPAAQYLTSAGVGTIGIADDDVVSLSNLNRQILYTPDEVGQKKVVIAKEKLERQNPDVAIIAHDMRITSGNIMQIISEYDIVVDCTDNFDTRYLLNDACVLSGKPLVYGAIYQYEGQVAVWNVLNEDGIRSPNYRDVFADVDATQVPNCAEGGVLPTVAGIVGCMQANEAIKYITRVGELLAGKLLLLDAQTLTSRIIKTGSVTQTKIISLPQTIETPTITADELKRMLDNQDVQLIDVRTLEEREHFSIGGEHIPLTEIQTCSIVLDNDIVVLYCETGKRSAEAVRIMHQRYPEHTFYSLKGGVKDWHMYAHQG